TRASRRRSRPTPASCAAPARSAPTTCSSAASRAAEGRGAWRCARSRTASREYPTPLRRELRTESGRHATLVQEHVDSEVGRAGDVELAVSVEVSEGSRGERE